MQIELHTHGIPATDTLREHVSRRLDFALSGIREHVRRITVRMSDINGPRGGKDKTCQIHVMLTGCSDVIIEHTESDVKTAIDCAADRAGQSAQRQLDKKRARPRGLDWRNAVSEDDI